MDRTALVLASGLLALVVGCGVESGTDPSGSGGAPATGGSEPGSGGEQSGSSGGSDSTDNLGGSTNPTGGASTGGAQTGGASSGGSSSGGVGTGGEVSTGGVGTGGTESECDITGFVGVDPEVAYESSLETTRMTDRTTGGEPFEALEISFFHFMDSMDGPGIHEFTGENAADCAECAFMFTGCTSEGCLARYLAQTGTLEITTWDSERIAGTLTDATFIEVVLGFGSISTPVPDGGTWCVPSYTFDVAFE